MEGEAGKRLNSAFVVQVGKTTQSEPPALTAYEVADETSRPKPGVFAEEGPFPPARQAWAAGDPKRFVGALVTITAYGFSTTLMQPSFLSRKVL